MADETWQDRAWAKRDELLRQTAADLDLPEEIVAKALSGSADAFAAALYRSRVERESMAEAVELAIPAVCAEVTRNFLRPALLAAGFDGEVAERYEMTWVREDGFRPGLFAQEGVEYGQCPPSSCPPWPEYVYDKTKTWPAELYTPDEWADDAEDVKPCRPIYCARHYGNVADAECVGAYQCPES